MEVLMKPIAVASAMICAVFGISTNVHYETTFEFQEGKPMSTENIHWYGQSAFRITDDGKQIYIDPWKLPSGVPKASIILVTHSHYDHFSPDDIAKILTPSTVVFAPTDVAKKLNAKSIMPNESVTVDRVKIATIPAYNLKKPYHPRANNWVGYIITLSNGETIYHAGDTDFIPEMKSLKVDVAMLPVGGTYTMDAKEAAEAANSFHPRIAIPMHYGDVVGSSKDAEMFKKLVHGEVVILPRSKN